MLIKLKLKLKGEVFMKISGKDGVEWKGISNKITKAEENTKKLKKLLDTPGEDKMGNKEVEQCNLCGHENELCGTYLTTRGNTYTEKTKDLSNSKGKGAILKNLNTKGIGERCIRVQSLVEPKRLMQKGCL